ncbi:hypothetical protein QQF64_024556 [Cirrhinus molitorella]|uniref:Uncharacterized protein n=1 Tax=Cirrhinus molitorella TaxID=172907 RepID=A0ABR3NMH2_9TELE
MTPLSLKENMVDFKMKICLREPVQRSVANLVFMKRTCMHVSGHLGWLLEENSWSFSATTFASAMGNTSITEGKTALNLGSTSIKRDKTKILMGNSSISRGKSTTSLGSSTITSGKTKISMGGASFSRGTKTTSFRKAFMPKRKTL